MTEEKIYKGMTFDQIEYFTDKKMLSREELAEAGQAVRKSAEAIWEKTEKAFEMDVTVLGHIDPNTPISDGDAAVLIKSIIETCRVVLQSFADMRQIFYKVIDESHEDYRTLLKKSQDEWVENWPKAHLLDSYMRWLHEGCRSDEATQRIIDLIVDRLDPDTVET